LSGEQNEVAEEKEVRNVKEAKEIKDRKRPPPRNSHLTVLVLLEERFLTLFGRTVFSGDEARRTRRNRITELL
jgi:hypothetical protein